MGITCKKKKTCSLFSVQLIVKKCSGTDRNAIEQWYCTCLTGARTIGSCAHIVSIIWYMGKGRHTEFNLPAEMLSSIMIDE